jgi:hypothetical protein
LGFLGQLECHCQTGHARTRALGAVGSQPHGGEGAFDWVAGSQVLPVLGGKVVERQQLGPIFFQALGRPWPLGPVDSDEAVEGFDCICFIRTHPAAMMPMTKSNSSRANAFHDRSFDSKRIGHRNYSK